MQMLLARKLEARGAHLSICRRQQCCTAHMPIWMLSKVKLVDHRGLRRANWVGHAYIALRTAAAAVLTSSSFALTRLGANLYEIDHCTAFGPCSTRGITPSSLLVSGEQISRIISRQRGETAREPKLPDNSRDPGNYRLNTASAPTTGANLC